MNRFGNQTDMPSSIIRKLQDHLVNIILLTKKEISQSLIQKLYLSVHKAPKLCQIIQFFLKKLVKMITGKSQHAYLLYVIQMSICPKYLIAEVINGESIWPNKFIFIQNNSWKITAIQSHSSNISMVTPVSKIEVPKIKKALVNPK